MVMPLEKLNLTAGTPLILDERLRHSLAGNKRNNTSFMVFITYKQRNEETLESDEEDVFSADHLCPVRVRKRHQEKTLKSDASPPKRICATSEQQDNANMSLSPKPPSRALPDLKPIIRNKLDCCVVALTASFTENKLSRREKTDIKDFITKSIVEGMPSPSPGFLYITGGPGTGKVSQFYELFDKHFTLKHLIFCYPSCSKQTTTVQTCTDEVKKWANQNGYDKPAFCFINMAARDTISTGEGGIMRTVLVRLAKSLGIVKNATIAEFEKQFKKRVVVLTLDEIDMLFTRQGNIGEQCVRTLVRWAKNKEMKFSLIGISNRVNDAKAERIRLLGDVGFRCDLLHFQ
jgi:hypothetical protein